MQEREILISINPIIMVVFCVGKMENHPLLVRQIFAVVAVVFTIEIIRIFLTIAIAAFKTGSF